MLGKIISQILFVCIIVIFVAMYFRYIEKRSLFYPSKEIDFFPQAAGLTYDDVFLKPEIM